MTQAGVTLSLLALLATAAVLAKGGSKHQDSLNVKADEPKYKQELSQPSRVEKKWHYSLITKVQMIIESKGLEPKMNVIKKRPDWPPWTTTVLPTFTFPPLLNSPGPTTNS